MTVDVHDLPDRVRIAVGQEVAVPLPSYAGAGLDWSVTPVGSAQDADVADVRVEVGAPPAPSPSEWPADGTAEPPPMALAPESLQVAGRRAGTSTWRLRLARSFDPEHPAAELDIVVDVV